jgi:hypothetical protein
VQARRSILNLAELALAHADALRQRVLLELRRVPKVSDAFSKLHGANIQTPSGMG